MATDKSLSQTRTFSLGQILSVTTGVMAVQKLAQVYEILDFMTADKLTTHQLPRAADEATPYIIEQLPWIAEIKPERIEGKRVFELIKPFTAKYGEFHELHPMHLEDHEDLSPAEDLRRLGFKGEILEFDLSDD